MRNILTAFLLFLVLNVRAQNDSLVYANENHFRNVRQLTFGGDNAEAYWSFDYAETKNKKVLALADSLIAVDVEGKQLGIDAPVVQMLGDWSPIPATYAGGVKSLADLELIDEVGQGRVDATIGSALDIFGGKLPYQTVLAWHQQHQSPQ